MQWAPVTDRPFPSQHLAERHFAELRVSPEAQPIYAALVPDSSFAQGSLIVETLIDAKVNVRGPILALERTESDWRYWMLDARGVPQPNANVAGCAACHAGAPAAPLFGAPRPEPPPPSGTAGFPAAAPAPGTTAPTRTAPGTPAPGTPAPGTPAPARTAPGTPAPAPAPAPSR